MRKILLALLFAARVFAAINANTVWEFQPSVGADANGCGFSIGVGTKTVTAATDLAVDATLNTKVTSANHNFVAGDVGKYMNITAGTGWTTGYYRIISAAANAATLDRSPAATSTGSGTYDLYDGIDYSDKGASPQVTIDNSTITATTAGAASNVITFSAAYTVLATDVGMVVNIASGTNITAGMYEITSVTTGAGGTWTVTGAQNLTTAGGAGSAIVGKMGGSCASLAGTFPTGGGMVGSNKVYFKATGNQTTTATITLATSVTVSNSVPFTELIGYTSTRGDGGQATIKQSSGTGYSMLTVSGNGWRIKNIIFDGNAGGTISGLNNSAGSNLVISNCKFTNWKTQAITSAVATEVIDSEFTGATSAAKVINSTGGNLTVVRSNIHDNTLTGPAITNTAASLILLDNLITKNTGTNVDALSLACATAASCIIEHNTIDGSGRDNIRITSWSGGYIRNNILTAPAQTTSGGANLNFSAGAGEAYNASWDGNAYWVGSGSSPVNFINAADEGTTNPVSGSAPRRTAYDVILTGSPYTASGSNDYSLNNTAGAGAAARGAGVPGTWPGGSSTGHFDFGAVQTASSGASAGTVSSIFVQ